MMDFSHQQKQRPRGENIVPMINVVFLLLIFFLMSAQIAPPEPVSLSLPLSSSDADSPPADTLFIDKDGTYYFRDTAGQDVLVLLENAGVESLLIRADAELSASVVTDLLTKLAALGIRDSKLVTGTR